jgi:tetratricopeptide (TPR) repeat protein
MIVGKHTAVWILVSTGAVLLSFAGCSNLSGGAESALEEGQYQEALSRVDETLDRDSSDVEAYLMRAKVLRRMADSTMAPDEYKALHRRAWEAEEQALSFGEGASLRKRVQDRRRQIYDQEISRGEKAYNLANKNNQQDLYRQSAAFFGAAGTIYSDSARPVLNEAYSRLRTEQREEVIPVLEQYVERADTAAKKAYKILGQLYLEADRTPEGIEMLGQAVQMYPDDRDLQALRLNAYNQSGNVDQALDAYRAFIEKQPDVARYRYNYGSLLLEAERYPEAIAQLEKAIMIQPSHLESQYNLGAAYINAALARDDSIAALEDGKINLPETDKEAQIRALTDKRQALFENAIPPLRRVRRMAGAEFQDIRQDACRALMVAYIQTDRPNRAAQVETCSGFAKPTN